MLVEELAELSTEIAGHRSRKKKTSLLMDAMRAASEEELPVLVAYLSGELPQGKIGVGYAAVRKAFESAEASDLENPVTLLELHAVLDEIAAVHGAGSTAIRHRILTELLSRCSEQAQKFLASLIVGELRQGALEGIMVDALAQASKLPSKLVQRATMLSGNVSEVARVALSDGVAGLRQFSLELFRPVQPMLAEPAEDVEAAIGQLGHAILEYKLDGVRVQIHKQNEEVRVFTRHLKEVTQSVPELLDVVRSLPARELILDGEVLALRGNGRPQPFQVTMKRFGRRRDIEALRQSLPFTLSIFDVLRVEGQDLIDETTSERHAALADVVPSHLIIPRCGVSEVSEAATFLDAAMSEGHEGVMAKAPDASYTAGGRGKSWLKIKPVHTLDLVILAAEWGSGRRKGWLSNLHLGARDAKSGQFVMIGKTFKGLTDEMLKWQTERLLQLKSSEEKHVVNVRPEVVVEVAFNEVQESSQYASGFALRFARVKRYRHDKRAKEADTIDSVAAIFASHRA